MANELQTKLDAILADKNTNLSPSNLKKGITLLGVTGTLEQGSVEGAKIFTSVEEMNADTGATEGDLAIIYGLEGQPLAVGSTFRKITFPQTVNCTVSGTVTFTSWLQAVDDTQTLDIMTARLNASQFYLNLYTDTGTIRVQYTGSAGVYTRKTFSASGDAVIDGDTLDFGMDIQVVTNWNELLNNFFVTSQPAFNGLYEYKAYTDTEYIKEFPISSFSIVDGVLVQNSNNYTELSMSKLKACLSDLSAVNNSETYPHMIYKRDGVYYLLSVEGTYPTLNHITIDGYIAAYCSGYATAYNYTFTERILDLENGTLTLNTTYSLTGPADSAWRITNIKSDILPILCQYNSTVKIGPEFTSYNTCIYHEGTSDISTKSFTGYISRMKYFVAPSQLNATADYVYEKAFYGANGVENGALGNPDCTTKQEVQLKSQIWGSLYTLNVPDDNIDEYFYNYSGEYVPNLVFPSKPTGAFRLFRGAVNLKKGPDIDMSGVPSIGEMFQGCTALEEIPAYQFTSAIDQCYTLFYNCSSLKAIPKISLGNVVTLANFADNCTSLVDVAQLDFSKITYAYSLFTNCPLLSNTSLNNILASLATIGSGFTATKTLKSIGLSSEQATTCQSLSNWSALSSKGWTTGY